MPESKETARDLPLVSVVMPAYNHERFVEEAVRSVWAQTYPNVELVVLNDGSPDRTGEILDRLLAESPIPMRVVHKENEGICKTLNRGVGLAQGEFIAFLASDDRMRSEKLVTEVSCLRQQGEEVAGCYSDMSVINEAGECIGGLMSGGHRPRSDIYLDILMSKKSIFLQASLFRLECVRNIGGFDESLKFEDLDFAARITRKYRMIYLEFDLVFYRITSGSLAKSLPTYTDDFIGIFESQIPEYDSKRVGIFFPRRIMSHAWFRICLTSVIRHDSIEYRIKYSLKSLYYNPVNYKSWIMLCMALLPSKISGLLLNIKKPN